MWIRVGNLCGCGRRLTIWMSIVTFKACPTGHTVTLFFTRLMMGIYFFRSGIRAGFRRSITTTAPAQERVLWWLGDEGDFTLRRAPKPVVLRPALPECPQ